MFPKQLTVSSGILRRVKIKGKVAVWVVCVSRVSSHDDVANTINRDSSSTGFPTGRAIIANFPEQVAVASVVLGGVEIEVSVLVHRTAGDGRIAAAIQDDGVGVVIAT